MIARARARLEVTHHPVQHYQSLEGDQIFTRLNDEDMFTVRDYLQFPLQILIL